MQGLSPRILSVWPWVAAAIAAAMLAAAHIFEALGYLPCDLCLRQREVYWAALATGLAVGGLGLVWRRDVWRWGGFALALIFALGAGIAFYHAGVEWKFWPGPTACATGAGGAVTADDIEALLGSTRVVVPCDEAAWRLFGVSMAGYNFLFSAALAGLSLAAGLKRPVQ